MNTTTKHLSPQLRARQQARAVENWNQHHAAGTPVRVFSIIGDPSTAVETITRSEAWLMGGHSAVVLVEGKSGGWCLDAVEALPVAK